MLDLVKGETERIDSRFLEPACGDGNFLVAVLRRKLAAVELKYGKSDFERRNFALLALMCIYGIELLSDNIAECRANLLKIFAEYLNLDASDDLYRAAFYVLSQNLVHGDARTMRTHDALPNVSSLKAANSLQSYYTTRFFRFLVSVRKITQHATHSTYVWVPMQTWNRTWTDEALYAKYGITPQEQEYIESQVRPMNLDAADDE